MEVFLLNSEDLKNELNGAFGYLYEAISCLNTVPDAKFEKPISILLDICDWLDDQIAYLEAQDV